MGFVISSLIFAAGLCVLAWVVPGMKVRGFFGAFVAALVCGLLGAVGGWALFLLLAPLRLFGTPGEFLVHAIVNAVLLGLTGRVVNGISFDRQRTVWLASLILTLAQFVLRG